MILRTFGPNVSEGVSTVRPILEYVCQVWNPYLVKHINKRATRISYGQEKEYLAFLGVLKWP